MAGVLGRGAVAGVLAGVLAAEGPRGGFTTDFRIDGEDMLAGPVCCGLRGWATWFIDGIDGLGAILEAGLDADAAGAFPIGVLEGLAVVGVGVVADAAAVAAAIFVFTPRDNCCCAAATFEGSGREVVDAGRGVTEGSSIGTSTASGGVATGCSFAPAASKACWLRVQDEEGTIGGGLEVLCTDLGGHSRFSLTSSLVESLVFWEFTLALREEVVVLDGCRWIWNRKRRIRVLASA